MAANKHIESDDVLQVYSGAGGKSIRKTALIMDLSRQTIQGHLRKVIDTKDTSAKDGARVKELEKLVEQQEKHITELRKVKYTLPPVKKRASHMESFCRFIFPDTHGCKADKTALAVALADCERVAPKEIVLLGDHLDCGGFLAQHHVMGYVAETSYTFEEDAEAANHFLNELARVAPDADIHFLEGNHERRIERWCVTQTIQNPRDAAYISNLFSVERVLSLKERGINFYKQGVKYHGIPIPATIKLGLCHFTHGSNTSKNAAKAMVEQFSGNVVYGHTHRSDAYAIRTVRDDLIGAWSPGCLCEIQPLWQHTNITGWAHGYGLQLVQPDGSFLHINVPIVDGKSYLMDLMERADAKKTNSSHKKGARAGRSKNT